jgi:hypothetical protein
MILERTPTLLGQDSWTNRLFPVNTWVWVEGS